MSFAEKGAVSDIDPAFFIGYLHRQNATGTLKFEDAPIQRAIYFRDGRVLFSSSNAAEDQLGAILVSGGKISQSQFDAIVSGLEPKQSIAAALAQGGHVSQRDIGDAARRKVEQIVASCCAQTTGQYEFEEGALPKGALDLKLTTEKVLISAFEVLEPSGTLSRILKSPMAVLARAEVEPADPELSRLREALDGVSNLADIGGKVGLPLAATEARAAALVVLGAASVVTSQIEEMALPDTGETSPDLLVPGMSALPAPAAAETLAFGQVSKGGDTMLDAGEAAFGGDSTLLIPPSEGAGARGLADETMSTGNQGGLAFPSSPSQSGALRAGGGRRDRATTQDLDAVKELIGSPSPAGPRPGSASIPSQRWEPVLSAQGRAGRNRGGLAETLRSPMAKSVAAVLLLGTALVFGWVAYTAQNQPAPRPREVNPTVAPSPVPTQVAGAEPGNGATAAAVSVAGSPGLVASTPAVTPAPSSTPGPSTPASPRPSAPPSRVADQPTPLPSLSPLATPRSAAAAPAVAPGAPSPASGYEALKAGRLAEAAAVFERAALARSSEFSVQLLVACSPQTIEKALQNDSSSELFVLPATVGGKPCHRLMRGFHPTAAEATQAVSTLPAYYASEGAKPRAVPLKSVLR